MRLAASNWPFGRYATALGEHRSWLAFKKNPGRDGFMFPSTIGTFLTPNSFDKAWASCLAAAKVKRRVTVHGLRYTFTDLVRLADGLAA